MDTVGKLKRLLKNVDGVAAVYIALILFALVAFVGFAIDIGYMYVAKGQLQNAADAGALAGASKMKYVGPGGANPNDLIQANARTEATTFTAANQAIGENVVIENDNSNVLSVDNDITVGHWNGTSYAANTTPANAIQVRARRTDEAPGGSVSLFFARAVGWETMGTSAEAVAALPVRATNFIAICVDACSTVSNDPSNPTALDPPRQFDRHPTAVPNNESFAWSSLLNSVSSVTQISPLICSESPNAQVCGEQIWTTQGTASSLFKDMEGAFNDPNHDRDNKEFSGSTVTGWWITVPVTNQCKPGNQPTPFDIWGYALIRVTSVCDTGGGQPCRPYTTTPCTSPKKIVVDRIACINCANVSNLSGLKTVLVK